MKKLQNRKGFTLVELLIVMAIIGVLVLIAIPQFSKSTQSSQLKAVQNNARTIVSAAGIYYADKGSFPADIKTLIDGKYLDPNAFGTDGKNAAPNKLATYEISGGNVVAKITLDKLADDGTDTNDFTTITKGAVVVSIPLAG